MIIKGEFLEPLAEIINKVKLKTFSIQTQYKFLKIFNAIQPEIQIINLQKEELAKKYAEKDENGQMLFSEDGGIKIKPDLLLECAKKLEELNEIKITLVDIYFSISELEDLGLTLEDLMYLEPFIKD